MGGQGTHGSTNRNNGHSGHWSCNGDAARWSKLAADGNKTRHSTARTNRAGTGAKVEVPIVVKGLGKGRKASSTKPSRLRGRLLGEERGEIAGMKFLQNFHFTMNFTNDQGIFEYIFRMKFFTVLGDASSDKEGQIAFSAIHPKRGNAKEGGELVGHVVIGSIGRW